MADSSLEGYVHLLSPIQSSNKTKTRYFNFKLQMAETDSVCQVCYSPEERVNLPHTFQNKSRQNSQNKTKQNKRRRNIPLPRQPRLLLEMWKPSLFSWRLSLPQPIGRSWHNLSESYKLNQKTSNQLYREKKNKVQSRLLCCRSHRINQNDFKGRRNWKSTYTVAKFTTFKT